MPLPVGKGLATTCVASAAGDAGPGMTTGAVRLLPFGPAGATILRASERCQHSFERLGTGSAGRRDVAEPTPQVAAGRHGGLDARVRLGDGPLWLGVAPLVTGIIGEPEPAAA